MPGEYADSSEVVALCERGKAHALPDDSGGQVTDPTSAQGTLKAKKWPSDPHSGRNLPSSMQCNNVRLPLFKSLCVMEPDFREDAKALL
jgi:hypothetical protein